MAKPLAKAAKRGGSLVSVPITVPPRSGRPSLAIYSRNSFPFWAREPARASPKPSRMDFLPRSITSAGRSVNFVFRTNSATYFVSPGVCGNGTGAQGGFSLAPSVVGDKPRVVMATPKVAEDRKKSRLFMAANTHFHRKRSEEHTSE